MSEDAKLEEDILSELFWGNIGENHELEAEYLDAVRMIAASASRQQHQQQSCWCHGAMCCAVMLFTSSATPTASNASKA